MNKKSRKTLVNINIYFLCIFLLFSFLLIGLLVTFLPFNVRLNGGNKIEIEYGEKYIDLGARNLFGKPIKQIEGAVDEFSIGQYIISYKYLNTTKQRVIIVKDSKAPSITLNGSKIMVIARGEKFVDPGCSAFDAVDGNITNKITTKSNLDINTIGEYVIEYEVEDMSNNRNIVSRKVLVIDEIPLELSISEFNLNNYFSQTVLKENNDSLLDEKMVYIGDSIIDNLALYGYLPKENVWSTTILDPENVNDVKLFVSRATSITEKLFNALEKNKPEKVCILMGTNLVSSVTVQQYIRLFEEFIQHCLESSKDTDYIICSILPTVNNEELNKKINDINYYMAALCEGYNIKFMNIAEALKDEDGYAKKTYYTIDGIHPNEKLGCKVLVKYIENHWK